MSGPLKLHGQESVAEIRAMANMIIHDMEDQVETGDAFKNPKLRTVDRVVDNLMWNQDWFTEADYDADELDRFSSGAGVPGKSSADWGWVQRIFAFLKPYGRAAVVWGTGAVSRGSGNSDATRNRPPPVARRSLA